MLVFTIVMLRFLPILTSGLNHLFLSYFSLIKRSRSFPVAP